MEEHECNRTQKCITCGETKNVMLYFARNYKACKACQKLERLKKRGYPVQKKACRTWYPN